MEPVEETELDLLTLEGKHSKAPGKNKITLHSETNHPADENSRHELAVGDKYEEDKKETT
eukprot:14419158-Ditylum_brightwellii.AAC.1